MSNWSSRSPSVFHRDRFFIIPGHNQFPFLSEWAGDAHKVHSPQVAIRNEGSTAHPRILPNTALAPCETPGPNTPPACAMWRQGTRPAPCKLHTPRLNCESNRGKYFTPAALTASSPTNTSRARDHSSTRAAYSRCTDAISMPECITTDSARIARLGNPMQIQAKPSSLLAKATET